MDTDTEGDDASTFASQMTTFHQTLIETSSEAAPFKEVVTHCCQSLGDSILKYIQDLLNQLQTHYAKRKEPVQKVTSGKSRRTKSRRPVGATERGRKEKSYAKNRLAAARGGAPKPQKVAPKSPTAPGPPELKDLEFKAKEDSFLFDVAECCRLLTSVDVLFESLSTDSRMFRAGFEVYSTMVRAVFLSRCRQERKELDSHRALATRTTKLGSVEAAGDDPYLKALSSLLGTAHMFVHELTMGSLNVGAAEGNEGKELLADIEEETYNFVMPVVESIYEDRMIAKWLARAEHGSSEEPMSEKDVGRLSSVLSDMMEVQQYCLGFLQFVDQVGLSGSDPMKQKSLEYVGAYVQLEMLWLDHSFRKAIDTAETQDFDGTLVNSVVDNTFYIIRVGFGRAVHTRSLHAASATANHIWFSLQEAYTKKIRSLMSSSLSQATPTGSHGEEGSKNTSDISDAKERFAAALDSDISGLGNLNAALLGAINTVELSAKFCKELEEMVREEFQANFPANMAAIDMALHGIEEVQESHEQLREGAIKEVVATCVTPTQRSALQAAMRKVSYDLTHSMYDGFERNDPFINKFLSQNIHDNEPLRKCKKHLTPFNYALVVCIMTEALTEAMTAELLQRQDRVNALGALRFEKDIQTLLNELVGMVDECVWSGDPAFECPPADVIRSHFGKLKHMSFLLQQPASLPQDAIEYPLDQALSTEHIATVLGKRT